VADTVDAEAKKKLIEILKLARGSILYFWGGRDIPQEVHPPCLFFLAQVD
jgi:hypothetical protein